MNQTRHKPISLISGNLSFSELKNEPDRIGDAVVRPFLEASITRSTRRAYHNDLEHFSSWGGCIPASPKTLAHYLADHAQTLSVATLSRRLVAIGKAHVMLGLDNPVKADIVRLTLRGIRRTLGQPQRQAAAATRDEIVAMVSREDRCIKDVRDRALILIGFAGAFRRSELVGIDCSDLEWSLQGVIVNIRRSKTDQEGVGRTIAIPLARGSICPVRALEAWFGKSGITEGPVFRPISRHGRIWDVRLSSEAVSVVVKHRAEAAGLQSTRYSGHSLRAGFATSAAYAGVPAWKIKQQTGHKSDGTLARYIRAGELFRDNPVASIL